MYTKFHTYIFIHWKEQIQFSFSQPVLILAQIPQQWHHTSFFRINQNILEEAPLGAQ